MGSAILGYGSTFHINSIADACPLVGVLLPSDAALGKTRREIRSFPEDLGRSDSAVIMMASEFVEKMNTVYMSFQGSS